MKIEAVDASQERQILTGAILSTRYLETVRPVLSPNHLLNPFAKKVLKWIYTYFDQYSKAPKTDIQNIYESKRLVLEESERTILETLLSNLSDKFTSHAEPFNLDYAVDQTVRYVKTREITLRISSALRLLEKDNVEQAEKEIVDYRAIAKVTSDWYNPFDPNFISEVFREDMDDRLIKFPGQVGEMLGWFERGWLVSVLGPFKRGKTWWMQEFAVLSLFRRLRVVFISLEMPRRKTNERLYKRLTAYSDNGGHSLYPTFDCAKNQDGSCTLPFRTNATTLLDDEGNRPSYHQAGRLYKPCTYCKDNGRWKDYKVATWFEGIERPKWTHQKVVNRLATFREHYGSDMLRVKCYPKFSANIMDIKRDLDILDRTEGFTPDVIVIDYAGILKPETTKASSVERLDETWMTLAQLAAERHCLVATASQANKDALDAKSVKSSMVAAWIGQLAHVDVMFALNQTSVEKANGVMRISPIVHRHKEFSENEAAWVLQNLHQGQINLDSIRGWGR